MRSATIVLCAAAFFGAASASVYSGLGGANGFTDDEACRSHAVELCQEPGSEWTQGPCHAVYGGFRGNADGLHRIMLEHFQDSFKFLVMVLTFAALTVCQA